MENIQSFNYKLKVNKYKNHEGVDTVESLSAGAAWLKVRYLRKNIGIILIAQKMCWVLS